MPSKDRKLKVGWMHRDTEADRFVQIKAPMGGTRTLVLNDTNAYTATEILDLAIAAFMKNNIFTQDLFKDCRMELGFFDSIPLAHFLDEDGNACDIWKYCKSQGKAFYRLRLYLLSTFKAATDSGSVLKKEEKDDVQKNETDDKQKNEETEEKLENVKDLKTNLKEAEVEKMTSLYNSDEKMPSLYNSDLKMPSLYDSDEKLTSLYDSDEMFEMSEDSETDEEKEKANSIEVLYQRVTVSKYSKLPSVIELNKKSCYRHLKVEMRGTLINKKEFDPLDFGFFISRITMDGKVLLNISVNDDCTKSYEFPAVNLDFQVKHTILHHYSQLYGFCEQKYGLGIIPYCDNDCQPIFRWKRNGKTVREGKFLYWYDDAQLTADDGAAWSCEIICNHAYGD